MSQHRKTEEAKEKAELRKSCYSLIYSDSEEESSGSEEADPDMDSSGYGSDQAPMTTTTDDDIDREVQYLYRQPIQLSTQQKLFKNKIYFANSKIEELNGTIEILEKDLQEQVMRGERFKILIQKVDTLLAHVSVIFNGCMGICESLRIIRAEAEFINRYIL